MNQFEINSMVNQIQQFKKTLKGDPKEQLQTIMNQVPQSVLNRAQEMAKPIYEVMKRL